MKPDRNPLAAHQIHLATVLGLCVPERVERGVRSHPKSCRIRISNYFCLGTYLPRIGVASHILGVHIGGGCECPLLAMPFTAALEATGWRQGRRPTRRRAVCGAARMAFSI